MSTSIVLLDQNFNAIDVDIMVFESSVLFSPAAVWGGGGIDDMVRRFYLKRTKKCQRVPVLIISNFHLNVPEHFTTFFS